MYITDNKSIKKQLFKQNTFKCGESRRDISLQFLTVNYTLICSFLLLKTVQLTAFYCKITLNVWLDLLQFFPVYST